MVAQKRQRVSVSIEAALQGDRQVFNLLLKTILLLHHFPKMDKEYRDRRQTQP